MSDEKKLKARVAHKHKTEAEWYLDVYTAAGSPIKRPDPFIPLDGELVIFDPDDNNVGKRFKFGNGVNDVIALPFSSSTEGSTSNIVYGRFGHSEGVSTLSGAKGYYIQAIAKVSGTTQVALSTDRYSSDTCQGLNSTISSAEVYACKKTDFENPYSIGDVVSINIGTRYDRFAKIIKTEYNIVTLSSDDIEIGSNANIQAENTTLFVPAKPDLGVDIWKAGAHAEGINTKALGMGAHAEGSSAIAYGDVAHAEGAETEAYTMAHSEGKTTKAFAMGAHAEGIGTAATGLGAHSEGVGNGSTTTAATRGLASGNYSHSEGTNTVASGAGSHAEGNQSVASGEFSHAEGFKGTASGARSHAEGEASTASGYAAHAEGGSTIASGGQAHAEGTKTQATAKAAHAEGIDTTASGDASHAGGNGTVAKGRNSFAHGEHLIVPGNAKNQFVIGQYNDTSDLTVRNALFIIGNGTDDEHRSNALAVLPDGTVKAKIPGAFDYVLTTAEEFRNLANYSGRILIKDIGFWVHDDFNLTVSEGTTHLEFENCYHDVIAGDYMDLKIVLDGANHCSISGLQLSIPENLWESHQYTCCVTLKNFTKVENVNVGGRDYLEAQFLIENCKNVSNSVVYSIKNSENIENITLVGDLAFIDINNCSHIKNVYLGDVRQLTFTNCHYIDGIFPNEGSNYAQIYLNSCSHIQNVKAVPLDEPFTDNTPVTYTNCTYVNVETCGGYISSEDVGKVQVLTNDGTLKTISMQGQKSLIGQLSVSSTEENLTSGSKFARLEENNLHIQDQSSYKWADCGIDGISVGSYDDGATLQPMKLMLSTAAETVTYDMDGIFYGYSNSTNPTKLLFPDVTGTVEITPVFYDGYNSYIGGQEFQIDQYKIGYYSSLASSYLELGYTEDDTTTYNLSNISRYWYDFNTHEEHDYTYQFPSINGYFVTAEHNGKNVADLDTYKIGFRGDISGLRVSSNTEDGEYLYTEIFENSIELYDGLNSPATTAIGNTSIRCKDCWEVPDPEYEGSTTYISSTMYYPSVTGTAFPAEEYYLGYGGYAGNKEHTFAYNLGNANDKRINSISLRSTSDLNNPHAYETYIDNLGMSICEDWVNIGSTEYKFDRIKHSNYSPMYGSSMSLIFPTDEYNWSYDNVVDVEHTIATREWVQANVSGGSGLGHGWSVSADGTLAYTENMGSTGVCLRIQGYTNYVDLMQNQGLSITSDDPSNRSSILYGNGSIEYTHPVDEDDETLSIALTFPRSNGVIATQEWVGANAPIIDSNGWINIDCSEYDNAGGLGIYYSDDEVEYGLYNINVQWYDSDAGDYQHAYLNFPMDKTGAQILATREWVMEYIASL